jgi:hypothetical protein
VNQPELPFEPMLEWWKNEPVPYVLTQKAENLLVTIRGEEWNGE